MTRRHTTLLLTGLLMVPTAACAPAPQQAATSTTTHASQTGASETSSDNGGLKQGAGDFDFTPGTGPEIDVYYAVAGDPARAEIVFAHHGTGRNAEEYRDHWLPLIEGRDVIVIAPDFDKDDFTGAEGYNLGGLGQGNPQEQAFAYVEPLFREVVAKAGGQQTTFDMFGHSAGAQFVHRYAMFAPTTAVDTAVAANAGWYTFPTTDAAWPYGLRGSPVNPDPTTYLQRELVVLLGEADVDPEDASLRDTPEASAQGATRLERGRSFHAAGATAAKTAGVPYAWDLHVVPGVDHDGEKMTAAAAKLLLDETQPDGTASSETSSETGSDETGSDEPASDETEGRDAA